MALEQGGVHRRRYVRGAAHDHRRAAAGAAAGGGAELMVKAVGLDHVVLNVADAERSLAWYRDELGLEAVRGHERRRGEVARPAGRGAGGGGIVEGVEGGRRGRKADHVCLGVEPPALESPRASGRLAVVEGPARRFGARGDGTSLYVLDPDGNVVELRHYA